MQRLDGGFVGHLERLATGMGRVRVAEVGFFEGCRSCCSLYLNAENEEEEGAPEKIGERRVESHHDLASCGGATQITKS
jgi:hypothetical protein